MSDIWCPSRTSHHQVFSSCGNLNDPAPPLWRVSTWMQLFPWFSPFSLYLSQPVGMKHALVRWMTPGMALAAWLNDVLYAIVIVQTSPRGVREVPISMPPNDSGILTPWTKPLENVRTSTYWVCTCTCQYENIEIVCTLYILVQEFYTGMNRVCTFRNLFAKVWTSMYLPGSQHFFVVWWIHPVMKCYRIPFIGTWKHICQSYFEKYCVHQWVNILSLYLVCTEYIQGLYLT